MRKNGRIVNISSVASGLTQYSDDIKQRFRNPKMKLQDLEDMVEEYQVCWNLSILPFLQTGVESGRRNRILMPKTGECR